jgi:hypothetical protein
LAEAGGIRRRRGFVEAVYEHEREGVVVKQKGGRYRRAIAAE